MILSWDNHPWQVPAFLLFWFWNQKMRLSLVLNRVPPECGWFHLFLTKPHEGGSRLPVVSLLVLLEFFDLICYAVFGRRTCRPSNAGFRAFCKGKEAEILKKVLTKNAGMYIILFVRWKAKGHGVMVTRGSPKPLLRVRILLPLPVILERLHNVQPFFCLYTINN